MLQEAKYVFKYDKGPVPIEEKVHAFVDPVEGRRWWEQEYESRYFPYVPTPRHPLNYKGTGVSDTQVIEANIVFEEHMPTQFDTNTSIFILYYLPDVDAYAEGSYFYGSEDGPEYPPHTSMTITLLDKTV